MLMAVSCCVMGRVLSALSLAEMPNPEHDGRDARGHDASARLFENAIALEIDDLLGLRDREGNRILAPGIGIGANEPVLLQPLGRLLLDHSGSLVLAVG